MKKTTLVIAGLLVFTQVSNAQWNTTGGNTLANPTTDYLGTNTTQNLSVRTNAIDRMNISPTGVFRFNGGFGPPTNPVYNFTGSEAENFSITDNIPIHFIGDPPPPPYDVFKIQRANTGRFPVAFNSVFKVTSTGFVGVNVATPQQMMHIHNGALRITGTNSSGGPMIILGGTYTTTSGDWGIEYGHSTTTPTLNGLNFWKPAGSSNAGNYYLFLADNGNIGMGTDNPGGYKLAVEGKIGAREIFVTNQSWADYVFESNYKRADLADVEKYIKENKHLPGIASAAEIKEQGGVDVGAMQLKQMEKIEELYLYMIDLKKENELLKQEVEELKKK